MRVSEILNGGVEQFLELAPSIEDHMENTDNPHGVTKEKIGLGNVTNDLQAKDTDFRSHKDAAVLDHPAGSVTTEKLAADAVTAEKIADGAVGSGALAKGCVADANLAAAVRKTIAGKVDKVSGMGLSQNSFTDAEKTKLGAITVVDEEQHVLDTEKLVLNTEPLQLCKSGMGYVYRGERVDADDVGEFITVETDTINGNIAIVYRDTAGVYTLRCYYYNSAYGWKWYTVKGTENTVCHYQYGGNVYFAEIDGNVVTVRWRTMWSEMFDYGTFTLSQTGTLDLRYIFKDSVGIRIVYIRDVTTSAVLHVDSFKKADASLLWTYSLAMDRLSDYTPPLEANDTIYGRRLRMVIKDEIANDLYIAPVLASSYGLIRLDADGKVQGKYFDVLNTTDTYVLQDLTRVNGKVYAWSRTYLHRYDIATGRETDVWRDSTTRLRGFDVDMNGRAYMLTEKKNGETAIHLINADRDNKVFDYNAPGDFRQVIDGTYLLARYTPEGFRLYEMPEGTTKIVSHLYVPTEIYTVV